MLLEIITFTLIAASASFLVLRDKTHVVVLPAFFIYIFLRDIYHGGFGHSNGRLLSFLDSFNSCYKFRVAVKDENIKSRSSVSAYSRAATLKFMAGTVTSLLLSHTPTIMRGPRHILSFSLAYVIIFGTDTVFLKMRRSLLSRLFLGVANALYKLRKLMFVLHHANATGFAFTMFVSLIAIEGSSSLRNLSCGHRQKDVSWWRIGNFIHLLSSFTEAIVGVTVIFFACAYFGAHEIEPSFMEPIISIFYWSYSEIRSHHDECVVNPDDLSLSLCVTAKWIGFIIFVVRNLKSDLFSLFYETSSLSSLEDKENGHDCSSITGSVVTSTSNLFMSPFKRANNNMRRRVPIRTSKQ